MKFVKMSGAGNDFVLLDAALLKKGARLPEMARRLCSRRESVGADGLLVLTRGKSDKLNFLDYYNADGSRAFCGNGSRCAAWWMFLKGWSGKRSSFDSIEGVLDAEIAGTEMVRIRMPEVKDIRLGRPLKAAGKNWTVHSLNTGVPHAVIEVKNLEDFPVFKVGREIRRHSMFKPAGTNVNFISIQQGSRGNRAPSVRIRTYERGVEDETLACGTGITASAICAHLLRGLKSPVRLLAKGGDILTVKFKEAAGGFKDRTSPTGGSLAVAPAKAGVQSSQLRRNLDSGLHRNDASGKFCFEDVWLEGPAKIIFEGEIKP